MILINIKYSNNKIKSICEDYKKMESFFEHDKILVEGLQVLMNLFLNMETIYDFWNKDYLKGYNLEHIINSNNLSIRIIPKKRKRKDRMILINIDKDGKTIEIVDIDSEHRYK